MIAHIAIIPTTTLNITMIIIMCIIVILFNPHVLQRRGHLKNVGVFPGRPHRPQPPTPFASLAPPPQGQGAESRPKGRRPRPLPAKDTGRTNRRLYSQSSFPDASHASKRIVVTAVLTSTSLKCCAATESTRRITLSDLWLPSTCCKICAQPALHLGFALCIVIG